MDGGVHWRKHAPPCNHGTMQPTAHASCKQKVISYNFRILGPEDATGLSPEALHVLFEPISIFQQRPSPHDLRDYGS